MAGLAIFGVACFAAGFGLWMRHSYEKERQRQRDERPASVMHFHGKQLR